MSTNCLTLAMEFISYIHSIDHADRNMELEVLKEMTNFPHLSINNHNSSFDAKDFNYKNIPLEDLYNKKMPYINNNRRIFYNKKGFSLIDLLQPTKNELKEELIDKHNILLDKVHFILRIIDSLIAKKMEFINRGSIHSEYKRQLIRMFDIIRKVLSRKTIYFGSAVYDFLVTAEDYFNEDSKIDFFAFIFNTKPSSHYKRIVNIGFVDAHKIKQFMARARYFYYNVWFFMTKIELIYSNTYHSVNGDASDVSISYILKEHIHFKWMCETNRKYSTKFYTNFDESNYTLCDNILVYSINADDVLFKVFNTIANSATSPNHDKKDNKPSVLTKVIGFNAYSASPASCYEFEAMDKKIYTLNVFCLSDSDTLPPGLSTAYLNSKKEFQSAGYIGFLTEFNDNCRHHFLSIEEKLSFYLITDDLSIFKKDPKQALYFVLEILTLLDLLCNYRIKLKTTRLIFAVDNADSTKWRYRLDDIGNFSYIQSLDIYENCEYLFHIINLLSKLGEEHSTASFFKHLVIVSRNLLNSKNADLIKLLSIIIESHI